MVRDKTTYTYYGMVYIAKLKLALHPVHVRLVYLSLISKMYLL